MHSFIKFRFKRMSNLQARVKRNSNTVKYLISFCFTFQFKFESSETLDLNASVSSLQQENLARLQRAFARKWEFIYMQAEAQVK